ncbi:MAG: transcription elongation factor GreA [Bacteroidia bacterium]|nr:transcription elongation factor GreA [Bacteroidia bacterium]
MTNINYLTHEGLKKLQEELAQLMYIERPKIAQKIADARDKGDLTENAEYDAAKDAQGMLEMKIFRLEEMIRNSRPLDESKIDTSRVQVLSKIKIKNLNTKSETTYIIVSEGEANSKEGKISVNSPIAKGLLGKKVGEKVEITIPSGKVMFEILEISKL